MPAQRAAEVYLVLESTRPASDITERLGLQPTGSRRFPSPIRGHEVTEWTYRLAEGDSLAHVIESVEERLRLAGARLAQAVAEFSTQAQSSAALVIIQHISEDRQTKGIQLSADTVSWLAQANAFISIDQYVDDEA